MYIYLAANFTFPFWSSPNASTSAAAVTCTRSWRQFLRSMAASFASTNVLSSHFYLSLHGNEASRSRVFFVVCTRLLKDRKKRIQQSWDLKTLAWWMLRRVCSRELKLLSKVELMVSKKMWTSPSLEGCGSPEVSRNWAHCAFPAAAAAAPSPHPHNYVMSEREFHGSFATYIHPQQHWFLKL